MKKRGLSNLIATVLIVLLALAAVAIVWGFLQPAFEDTGTSISLRTKCLEIEARAVSCTGAGGTVEVQLARGDSSDIDSVVAVVTNDAGSTFSGTANPPSILGSTSVPVSGVSSCTTAGGCSAQAAVIVTDGEGNTETCDPSPTEALC